MAKQRMIDTKFWGDNWVLDLDPIEKLLFLYLLTNERTNISGIYELPLRLMALETGIDKEMIPKILKRFERDKKIIFRKNWVVLRNFLKHQKSTSPMVVTGVKNELEKAPQSLIKHLNLYPMDRVRYDIDTLLHLTKSNLTKSNSIKSLSPTGFAVDKPVNKSNNLNKGRDWAKIGE